MTVYLLNGEVYEHPYCEARVHDGVLHVSVDRPMGYGSSDPVAHYPLVNVVRWTP